MALAAARTVDREVVLAAVSQHGEAIQYTYDEFKNDREVVLAAVGKNGYALRHVSARLKSDREVVLTAIRQEPPGSSVYIRLRI